MQGAVRAVNPDSGMLGSPEHVQEREGSVVVPVDPPTPEGFFMNNSRASAPSPEERPSREVKKFSNKEQAGHYHAPATPGPAGNTGWNRLTSIISPFEVNGNDASPETSSSAPSHRQAVDKKHLSRIQRDLIYFYTGDVVSCGFNTGFGKGGSRAYSFYYSTSFTVEWTGWMRWTRWTIMGQSE